MRKRFIAAILLAGFGVFFLAMLLFPKAVQARADASVWAAVSQSGMTAQGAVTDVDAEVRGSKRHIHTVYCPAYSFETADASGVARAHNKDCQPTRDEALAAPPAEIIFDPENPQRAFVNSPETRWHFENDVRGGQWLVFGFGAAMLGGGIFAAYATRPAKWSAE